ncbi:hypothetical protein [Pedobacter sp. SYSU D00535]|uniref:hypothetical protein n=1 Tax=Pedobacter sp. SYSU D00535 TaxID=2810308 RepID=UPI001A956D74|nr:hypothetical protein [Pedobacter sp. SYSU D00535]
MNLVNAIQSIVATLTGEPHFTYQGKFEHNVKGDDKDYSTANVNLLELEQIGFKKNSSAGGLRDRFPIFIEFVKQVDQNLTAEERRPVIEEMRLLAAEFILAVDESDLFEELPETISGVVVIDRYDVNVAGVEINLVLIANEPMSFC